MRPLILRYKFTSDSQRDAFISSLKQNLIGRSYDFKRILHLFIYSKVYEIHHGPDSTMAQLTDTYKYSETDSKVICTHHILKNLIQLTAKEGLGAVVTKRRLQTQMYSSNLMSGLDSELMKRRYQSLEILEFEKFGTYTPNDIMILHLENPNLFYQFQLFE